MTDTKFAYKAFGLRLVSEIHLPELTPLSENENDIDVVIKIADLSETWAKFAPFKKKIVVEKDLLMLQLNNIALFCVQEGKKIIVSPLEESDQDQIRLYILGLCMGALLMQRKVLPLHGSALAIGGKAYGFIGDSGAGKSTIATALLDRGYQFLSDDVIAVSLNEDNIPIVLPAFPQQKLWQETLKEFNMQTDGYSPISQRETKYLVPVPSKFSARPIPLAGVFELVKTEHEKVEVFPIQKLERLHTLLRHTYNKSLISRFELVNWHFVTSASIVNHIDLFQLRRPKSGFTACHLASQILTMLNKEC